MILQFTLLQFNSFINVVVLQIHRIPVSRSLNEWAYKANHYNSIS
jgi:hypothetical protein